MSTVTFYTTFPKGMPTKVMDEVVDEVIRHGVRKVDFRNTQAKFTQVFIHCLDDRREVQDLLEQMKSEKNGRVRKDYDLGGRTRGYLLISEYKPKPRTDRKPRTSDTDLRSELMAMMRVTRDLEKEIERLQRENADLRTRMAATTELPRIAQPVSPGYCPTSPNAAQDIAATATPPVSE